MELDDADQAYIESLIPDGAIPHAMVTVVAYLDDDAEEKLVVHITDGVTASATMGMLRMAEYKLALNVGLVAPGEED